jgi:outer membrane receptor protein involved in Fe transport
VLVAAQLNGQITVRVRDQTGADVPLATLTLTNIATGAQRVAVTNSSGQYVFDALPMGMYRLRVRRDGFSEAVRTLSLDEASKQLEADVELAPGTINEEITVTAARGGRDVLDVAARTETLSDEIILRQNPVTTGDLLVNLPNVTPVNSGPLLVRPRLRGLDSTRLLILVDGERLNNSRTSTGAAGVEIGLIDPSVIETIEVVHGLGAALYGTDALSGTINITTRMPERVDQRLRVGGGLASYYSTNEKGRRGSGHVDVSGRWFAVRLFGMLERFPNYHAGEPFDETNVPMIQAGVIQHKQFGPIPDNFNEPFTRASAEIPNSQSHGHNWGTTARLFFGHGQTLRLNWLRRRAASTGFPDFAPPYFFQVISVPRNDLDKASVRYESSALTSWLTRLSVGGFWQHQNRTLKNEFFVLSLTEPRPGDPPYATLTRVDVLSHTGQNVKSAGYDLQANVLLTPKNLLTAGTSLFRDHNKDFRFVVADVTTIGALGRPPAPPQFFPLHVPVVRGAISQTPRVPISNFQNFAVFFQDEHELTRSARVVGSLRVDRFDIDMVPTPNYNPVAPELADADPPLDPASVPPVGGIQFNRTTLTGDFGLVVRPKSYLSLTARLGRSFRHPNLSELFFSGPAEAGVLVPNINVGPEKGINVDVGVKLRTSRASGSLTYFNNSYRDFLSRQAVSFSRMSGGVIYQAVNFSRVRIEGFEGDGEISIQAGKTFFTLWGNASYLRGTVLVGINPVTRETINNTPAPNITPFKVIVGVRWQETPHRFWWEYSARVQPHVHRVSPLVLTSPLLQPQDLWNVLGFTVHALRSGVKLSGREHSTVTVTVGAENFGNKFYREHFQFAPARGRSLTIGVNARFF